MRLDKRAAIGEGVFMIYRIVLVCIIAFAIFGVASIFYAYYIDVRDAEAVILTRQVSECLAPDGVLDLDSIPESSRDSILSYCGFSNERFYMGIKVLDSAGNFVAKFSQGDSGADWVKKLTGGKGKYDPGHATFEYPVSILRGTSRVEGKVEMEVVVSHEF